MLVTDARGFMRIIVNSKGFLICSNPELNKEIFERDV